MENQEKTFVMVLRDLESLLRKKLGDDLEVLDYETEPLLSLGENYGSTMLKVRAKIRRKKNEEEEELHLAAKMLPPTSFQRELFESPYTFKKEAFLYEELIPSYQQLEREFGVKQIFDILPEFFGARFSLSPEIDEVDEDAVILMRNLKVQGYYTADRRIGIDLEHAKVAVEALARFHGLGVAMKTHKPELFEVIKTRTKCLDSENADEVDDFTHFLEVVRQDPEMSKHYDRLELATAQDSDKLYFDPPTEPWSTVIHSDFWINNFMFLKEGGRVADIKFVDFQNYLFMSPLRELTFFLMMNLRLDVMEESFDRVIDLYYDSFVRVLREMKCDVEPFSRHSFDERFKIDAFEEFPHIPLMLRITNLDSKEDHELVSAESAIVGKSINSLCLQKLRMCVKKYVEKGWLYNEYF